MDRPTSRKLVRQFVRTCWIGTRCCYEQDRDDGPLTNVRDGSSRSSGKSDCHGDRHGDGHFEHGLLVRLLDVWRRRRLFYVFSRPHVWHDGLACWPSLHDSITQCFEPLIAYTVYTPIADLKFTLPVLMCLRMPANHDARCHFSHAKKRTPAGMCL